MITKLGEKLADFFVVYDKKVCEKIYVYGCEIIMRKEGQYYRLVEDSILRKENDDVT